MIVVIYSLWLITASYATQVHVYPDEQSCAIVAQQLRENLPVGIRIACVPFPTIKDKDEGTPL